MSCLWIDFRSGHRFSTVFGRVLGDDLYFDACSGDCFFAFQRLCPRSGTAFHRSRNCFSPLRDCFSLFRGLLFAVPVWEFVFLHRSRDCFLQFRGKSSPFRDCFSSFRRLLSPFWTYFRHSADRCFHRSGTTCIPATGAGWHSLGQIKIPRRTRTLGSSAPRASSGRSHVAAHV